MSAYMTGTRIIQQASISTAIFPTGLSYRLHARDLCTVSCARDSGNSEPSDSDASRNRSSSSESEPDDSSVSVSVSDLSSWLFDPPLFCAYIHGSGSGGRGNTLKCNAHTSLHTIYPTPRQESTHA